MPLSFEPLWGPCAEELASRSISASEHYTFAVALFRLENLQRGGALCISLCRS